MRSITLFSLFVILFAAMPFAACYAQAAKAQSEAYQCPMKCEGEKVYSLPGKCPVCKMNLAKVVVKQPTQPGSNAVQIAGAMKNVMRKGELFGTIALDTISRKKHLYGIGPVEYLKGEIMVVNGKQYVSTVTSNGKMKVVETNKIKAPFFVYADVDKWKQVQMPADVKTMEQLETFLLTLTKGNTQPFAFKIAAVVENATIHIVNLPKGTKINSPEDANKNQQSFKVKNELAELVGFFSTGHQGIFTHHDSFMHVHLITANKNKMGHLDEVTFKSGTATLFVQDTR